MKLETNIPQLIPMNGRRVKIYHKGIMKLCTKCFGNHKKQTANRRRKQIGSTRVANFMAAYQEVPLELFGKWAELVDKHQRERMGKSNREKRHENKGNWVIRTKIAFFTTKVSNEK